MTKYFKADCSFIDSCLNDVLEPESSFFGNALRFFETYSQSLDHKVFYILAQRNADKRYVNRKRSQMMHINSELEQGLLNLETFKDDFNNEWATDYNDFFTTSAMLLNEMRKYMNIWMDILYIFRPKNLPTKHDIEVYDIKPRDAREISPLADGEYMPYLFDKTTLIQEVQNLFDDIHRCYDLYIKCFNICQEILKEEEEIKKSPQRAGLLYGKYMSEAYKRFKNNFRFFTKEFIIHLRNTCQAYKDYMAANTEEEFVCNGFHKYDKKDADNFGNILLYDNSHNKSETEKSLFGEKQKEEEMRYIIQHFDDLLPLNMIQTEFAFYQYALAKWADVPVKGFVDFFNQEYTGKWKASKKSNVNKQNKKYNRKSDNVKDFEFAIKNLLNSKKEHTSQTETA